MAFTATIKDLPTVAGNTGGTAAQKLQRRIARETIKETKNRNMNLAAAQKFVRTATGLTQAEVEKLLAPTPGTVTIQVVVDVPDVNLTVNETNAANVAQAIAAYAVNNQGAVVQSLNVIATKPTAKKAPAKKAAPAAKK
jgi:hypothetical protein